MYTMNSYTINKILVPVDFSPESSNALETAIAICTRQLATLTLIHVIENSFVLFPPEAGGAAGVVLPKMLKDANDNLNNLAKTLRKKHDLVVNHVVQTGNPADEICSWATHKEIDLIVMGTHGASGLKEFFLGSNAYSVVRNSSCPVMTIPGTNRWLDFRKILFPIRLIPHALDKYDVVRPIIRKNGSSLLIAGIVKKDDATGFIEMKTMVDNARAEIAGDDVICSSEVHYCEDVSQEVLEIANKEKPDLVVITANLGESLRDFFLGNYAQGIVNHAHFPVLSIRPEISAPAINKSTKLKNAVI
jgi:nucleotide-binding universal stress UspA family protein